MAAPVAVAQHLLAAVRLAAQNKLATDPLSSPPSSHLKDTMKFKVYRDLAKLVSLIAAASSDGVNPLCLAGPQQEGAFVQVNQRLELSPGQVGFLFMFAVQFLHRAELPPLHKYCAPKKGAYTTPWRYAHEELRLYDPVARTYCAMYALTGAYPARTRTLCRSAPCQRTARLAARARAARCGRSGRAAARALLPAPCGRAKPLRAPGPLGLGAGGPWLRLTAPLPLLPQTRCRRTSASS